MKPCEQLAPRVRDDATEIDSAPSSLIRAARLLLVVALLCGAWLVYRALPEGGRAPVAQVDRTTRLRFVRRVPGSIGVDEDVAMIEPASTDAVDADVELYSIDTVAAERDFRSERREGIRFREFIRERSKRRPPLSARFDASDTAALRVAPGRWWIHARYIKNDLEWTWRVPVNVAGREQTIELTAENVYTHSQSY